MLNIIFRANQIFQCVFEHCKRRFTCLQQAGPAGTSPEAPTFFEKSRTKNFTFYTTEFFAKLFSKKASALDFFAAHATGNA